MLGRNTPFLPGRDRGLELGQAGSNSDRRTRIWWPRCDWQLSNLEPSFRYRWTRWVGRSVHPLLRAMFVNRSRNKFYWTGFKIVRISFFLHAIEIVHFARTTFVGRKIRFEKINPNRWIGQCMQRDVRLSILSKLNSFSRNSILPSSMKFNRIHVWFIATWKAIIPIQHAISIPVKPESWPKRKSHQPESNQTIKLPS